MGTKVSNKTISSAWSSGTHVSHQAVGNKDEISDVDKSCPNEPVPHQSKKWCGTRAYKKIGAFVAFVSAVATIVVLLVQFLSSSVGKISSAQLQYETELLRDKAK